MDALFGLSRRICSNTFLTGACLTCLLAAACVARLHPSWPGLHGPEVHHRLAWRLGVAGQKVTRDQSRGVRTNKTPEAHLAILTPANSTAPSGTYTDWEQTRRSLVGVLASCGHSNDCHKAKPDLSQHKIKKGLHREGILPRSTIIMGTQEVCKAPKQPTTQKGGEAPGLSHLNLHYWF